MTKRGQLSVDQGDIRFTDQLEKVIQRVHFSIRQGYRGSFRSWRRVCKVHFDMVILRLTSQFDKVLLGLTSQLDKVILGFTS